MNPILSAILVVAVIGLIGAVILVVASIVMHVPVDEREEKLNATLAGANCGACGYAGCADYARAIVEDGVRDLAGVRVVGTDRYLISSATFPDYFLKDKSRSGEVWTNLDLAVFCRAAKALGITRRFVGSEPFCPVTGAYNAAMAANLPGEGIEFVEIERMEQDGTAVSATAVRKLVAEGRLEEMKKIVPEATARYFEDEENRNRVLTRMGVSSSH